MSEWQTATMDNLHYNAQDKPDVGDGCLVQFGHWSTRRGVCGTALGSPMAASPVVEEHQGSEKERACWVRLYSARRRASGR